jgi:ACT domain-containing protein
MKAVITVIGKDSVGIISMVSTECAKYSVNIIDITQSVLKEYFAMIMIVEIGQISVPFSSFQKELEASGREKGLEIRVMHEDIFNTMHRI